MEKFQFRTATRIISVIELIALAVGFLGLVFVVVITILVTSTGASPGRRGNVTEQAVSAFSTVVPHAKPSNIIILLWIFVVISGLILAADVIAAYKLCRASDPEANCETALNQSLFWRNITIISTILTVISYAINLLWVPLLLSVVVNGIFIYLVTRYIDELRIATGVMPEVG